MPSPRNLVDLLQVRAEGRFERPLYSFLAEDGEPVATLNFGELELRARAVGARLAAEGVAGERVILLFPPSLDFLVSFFGCLYAGAVPVPSVPPRLNRSFERLETIIADCAPRFALTASALQRPIEARLSGLPGGALRVLAVDDADEGWADRWSAPKLDGDSLAFLQYTSGSTSSPRGVIVSHGNLLANLEVLQRGFQDRGLVVSWLPLFHDMGLIAMVLRALYVGVHCVLMAPTTFLRRPASWLEAITRWRASLSGAPDFAYNLCARKVTAEEREQLDLSSWQVAFNGAEPVRAETIDRFSEVFAPCGFRRRAFYPAYGLAEATLMVAGGDPAADPVEWEVDAAALELHTATAARDGRPARRLVASGRPPSDHRVIVVDPETRSECPAGRLGEIWYAGPSVARGYWGREEDTRETFRARLAGATGVDFLRTGDLGFLHAGEVFVTGRLKDLVIVRGRNHYPQDLELAAEESHPDLRPGCSAAFTVERLGEERLTVVGELRRHPGEAPEAVAAAVRRAIAERHEVTVHDVVLVRVGSIPKTTSGKIQRRACRALYLAGELTVIGGSRLADDAVVDQDAAGEPPAGCDRATLAELDESLRRERLEAFLADAFAAVTRRHRDSIDPALPLTAQGLDSLTAVELRARVEKATDLPLTVDDLFDGGALAELATRIARRVAQAGEPARLGRPAERAGGDAPLSHGEAALWFLHRLAPATTAYHVAAAARLRGALRPDLLESCLATVSRRHPALRTTFHEVAGEPRARIHDEPRLELVFEELPADALAARLAGFALRPFDLERGPLMRVGVFTASGSGDQAADEDRFLVLSFHHLIVDLWSFAVVLGELTALYRQRLAAAEPAEPPRPTRAAGDFARWQRAMLAGPEGERLWSYWSGRLAGLSHRRPLPTDRAATDAVPAAGERVAVLVEPEVAAALRRLASDRETTLFTVVLSALQVLLYRYGGETDLAIGTPVTLRRHAELTDVVGYLVNTVVLRGDLSGRPAFDELLDRQRRVVVDALAHGDLPLSLLAERLRPQTGPSWSPFYRVMLVWEQERSGDPPGLAAFASGAHGGALDLGCVRLEPVALPPSDPQSELVLVLAEAGDTLAGEWSFDAGLFDRGTIEQLGRHLGNLLKAAAEAPSRRIDHLPLLDAAERRQLLAESGALGPFLPHEDLHASFEEQARRRPGAQAVVAERTISFGELDAAANRLARHLVADGVRAETVVGLALPSSVDLVVALYAVLKSGGAFVVLDPALPPERTAWMLADAGARRVIQRCAGGADAVAFPSGVRVVALDDERERIAAQSDAPLALALPACRAAYIVYTSGSSGRPKGVVVEHAAAARHMAACGERYGLDAADRVLITASFSFDVALEDLFAPLGCGASIRLLDGSLPSPEALLERVAREDITVLDLSPGLLAELTRAAPRIGGTGRLRRVLAGGETLPVETARAWLASPLGAVPLVNAYGPTEAVVTASVQEVTSGVVATSVPIGRALGPRSLRVLDRAGGLVPSGGSGELVIGGPALARAYLGRPRTTAERFVPDPDAAVPGARVYRTGDLVRRRADGLFEHLGRLDRQVKVRGFRIEPGEIEAVLRDLSPVAEAAVVARPGSAGTTLAAYVVPAPGVEVSPRALGAELARRLPRHMLPDHVVVVAAMPRDASGKVDRRALPAPPEAPAGSGDPLPLSQVEELLAVLWLDVLGDAVPAAGRITPDDDFFALGGHSLSAVRLLSRLRETFEVDLDLGQLLAAPRLAEQARRVEMSRRAGEAAGLPPLERLPPGAPRPVSHGQERLWFLDRLAPGSARYHLPGAIRLAGPLDAGALGRTVDEIVARHQALRSRFPEQDGRPRLEVAEAVPGALARVDLRALPAGRRATVATALARREARRPFDLSRGPLLRACLLRLADDEHLLVLVLHHAVADGWSLQIVRSELERLYAAFVAGSGSPLDPLPFQYADYAAWQRRWLAGGALDRELALWRHRLSGAAVLELPIDRPRPAHASTRGAARAFELTPEQLAATLACGRRTGATTFMVLLAAFGALLARYSNQNDVVVGAALANRGRRELESLVGFFVNTVVLRAEVAPGRGFRRLIEEVRERTLEAYAHQELPFEKLVEALGVAGGGSPLVQVMVAFEQEAFTPPGGAPAWTLEPIDTGTAKFDLTLEVLAGRDGIRGQWIYSRDLFDPATVERMRRHYDGLLSVLLADPELDPWRVPLLSAAEVQQVTREWNRPPAASAAPVVSVVARFAERAAARPGAVAVVCEDRQLTYGELRRLAAQLAARLQRLGVGPETLVPLAMERSIDMVVAILGVLEAGAAYVPLDPTHPADRLAFVLEEIAASVVVTGPGSPLGDTARGLTQVPAIDGATVGEPPPPPDLDPQQGAYVIFTSGSTGRPKGVVVTHGNLARLFTTTEELFDFGEDDTWTLFHSFAFDFSVWEMWGALLYGGRLVVVPYWVSRAPDELLALLSREGVTVLNQTPSAFLALVGDEQRLARCNGLALRTVIFGGEALAPGSLAPWLERHGDRRPRLVNMYGITETTVHVSYRPMARRDAAASEGSSPIGRALPDLALHVVDRWGQLVPVGVTGEILVGGEGLARGYLRRPALTAERFVPDPFSGVPGARLYRAGDLARWRAGGGLEYLGRIDHQVKIRGHRIELGEVEAALRRLPEVRDAVVVAGPAPGGGQRLIAYVVGADEAVAAGRLAARLRSWLPAPMIPSAWVALPEVPLTANGKVDRRALPPPADPPAHPAAARPASEIEALLAALWAEVLGGAGAGRDDDFFALGGHSLLATQLVSRVRRTFGVELALPVVFESPTLAAMAGMIAEALGGAGDADVPIEPLPHAGGSGRQGLPLSPGQRRVWFLDRLHPGVAAYNVPGALDLEGPLAVGRLSAALRQVAARHESLRTVIVCSDGEPLQRVLPDVAIALPRVDLSALSAAVREREAARLARREAGRSFDLERGPLLRVTLLVSDPGRSSLLVVLHHVIADGWSVSVLLAELAAWYEALGPPGDSRRPRLPALPVQAGDHAAWQHERLASGALEGQRAYWRRRLAGAPRRLELPTDRPRPPEQSLRGGDVPLRCDGALAAALGELGRRQGVTSFMILLAGVQLLLARLSGSSDIVVGAPVANRRRPELEPLIGFFVNTLVLRGELSGCRSFRDVLVRARETALGALAHQDLPFEAVVGELATERSLSETPLFQAVLSFQAQPPEVRSPAGLRMVPRALANATAKFDLTFELTDTGDGLEGRIEYATALFDRGTVERMGRQLRRLLAAAAEAEERSPWTVPLLDSGERHQVLHEWNPAPAAMAPPVPVVARFLAQAARRPSAEAVRCEGRSLRYGDLEARSRRLARHLRGQGVGPEVCVGLCLQRSLEMVVAVVAVLRAGGAYVPLAPTQPAERARFILDDVAAPLVLTQRSLADSVSGGAARVLCVEDLAELLASDDEAQAPAADGLDLDHPAYVIYTSGSTGQPKGVVVTHRNLARLFTATESSFRFGEDDVWTLFHSYAFDFSVWEIWGALVHGGRLVVVPYWVSRSPERFHALLADEGVTVLNQTPSAFLELIRADERAGEPGALGLGTVIFGGEALDPAALRPWLARHGDHRPRLVNMYGITETTVHVTVRPLDAADAGSARHSPIGRAIGDLRLYLVDRHGGLVPPGVPGELLVGGEGLARGYLRRAALTAERFVPDPFGPPGGRLYRSGDLARWRAGGDLEYLGRIDHQVKVRGHRVELGEVEAALLRHEGVEQAAVVVRDDRGTAQLVAFVTGEGAPDGVALRRLLQARLPEPMVPSFVHRVDRLPLTTNGKLDRAELARRSREIASPARSDGGWSAPREGREALLAGIWEEVLGVRPVGANDNFFDLGGDSILGIKIVARAHQAGLTLTPQHLFQHQTVSRLAAVAETSEPAPSSGDPVAPEGDGGTVPDFPRVRIGRRELERLLAERAGRAPIEDLLPLTPLQQGMLFHVLETPGSGIYVHQQSYLLAGDLDVDAFAAAFRRVVRRHQILRASFDLRSAGEPLQVIAREAEVPWSVHDLREIGMEEQRREVEVLFRADREAGFDLSHEPLMRFCLARLADDRFHLAWTFHLTLLDGWSTPLVLDEVLTFYQALRHGRDAELPPAVHYARYVDWLARQDPSEAERYWRRLLDDFEPGPGLAADAAGGAAGLGGDPGELTLLLEAAESDRLRDFARRHRLTVNTLFQGAWALCLGQRGGSDDVVFGNVVATRPADLPEVERIVGVFLNALPVRARIDSGQTVLPWLDALQRQQAEARRFAHSSQADIQRWSGAPAGTPLYESALIFQNVPGGPSFDPAGRWDVRVVEVRSIERNNFPLTLAVEPGERLLLRMVYDGQRFAAITIERLLASVRRLLAEMVDDPGRAVGSFSRGPEIELGHLIQGFNQDLEVR